MAKADVASGPPESPISFCLAEFVANSPSMQKLREQLPHVARVDVPVLCLGESGTGKEVVARMLHQLSLRAHRPFLKVNCAALPFELLESELFGYDQGAFTGAVRSKPGKFELCHRGTIFLDEIAEMPVPLQAKLLHVLQDGEFTRLGGCSRIRVDVRVIAATNVDIRQAIAARQFREDLFYRLSTVVFRIPPLRDRREDIPTLLENAAIRFARDFGLAPEPVSREFAEMAMHYSWPGNVRQLENAVKQYLILGPSASNEGLHTLDAARELASDTAWPRRQPNLPPEGFSQGLSSRMRAMRQEAESASILEALEQTRWNRKEAARLLQISYKSLLLKIRRYSLDARLETDTAGTEEAANGARTHVFAAGQ